MDAVMDTGMDAGMDAVMDTGMEAVMDAGMDLANRIAEFEPDRIHEPELS